MAIRLEQQAQATIGAAAASVNFTLTNSPTNGNMLICAWGHNDATNPVMSGTGVVWTRQNTFLGDASHDNIALYTGVVGPGASTTQTFTQSGSLANCAGILLEFSGVQQVLDGTAPTPTNLSSATPSITSNGPFFPADLVVAFMENVANSAPTGTPSGWQTVTAATNTRRIDGAYNLTSGRTASTAQWSYSGSQFALAEIVLVKAAVEGTTTSSSSISTTSASTSSTSASTSSTSFSSTSTSASTSSTSMSTSSTSSSISSTSSSISSTSSSSTSASTSVSSTSSSISSTSQSSTSLSSTSSSSSISSTSTSFSSTSSSQSSTSRSTSSTSFSSTSSSSSTSTTTIPSNLDYTYQDSLTLPATGIDEINVDSNKNVQNVAVNDSDYFIQYGSEYMPQEYKRKNTNNTDTPSFTWKGRSTYDTRVSPMLIQIFNTASSSIADNYSESNEDATVGLNINQAQVAQSFTGNGGVLSKATFYLQGNGGAGFPITVAIFAHSGAFGTSSAPTGAALATAATVDTGAIPNGVLGLVDFTFTGANQITLTSGTKYVVQISKGLSGTTSVGYDGSSPTHPGNYWDNNILASSTKDVCFYIYTTGAWETLATVNKVPADTDFSVTISQTTNVSNYYDSNNIVTFRSYQQVI